MNLYTPLAIQQPGAPEKQGYPDGAANSVRGVICHSMEGYADAALAEVRDPNMMSAAARSCAFIDRRLDRFRIHGASISQRTVIGNNKTLRRFGSRLRRNGNRQHDGGDCE